MKKICTLLPFLLFVISCVTIPPSELTEIIIEKDSRGAITSVTNLATDLVEINDFTSDIGFRIAHVGLEFDRSQAKKFKLKLNEILIKVVNKENFVSEVYVLNPIASQIPGSGSGIMSPIPTRAFYPFANPQKLVMYYVYPENSDVISIILDDGTEIFISQDPLEQELPVDYYNIQN